MPIPQKCSLAPARTNFSAFVLHRNCFCIDLAETTKAPDNVKHKIARHFRTLTLELLRQFSPPTKQRSLTSSAFCLPWAVNFSKASFKLPHLILVGRRYSLVCQFHPPGRGAGGVVYGDATHCFGRGGEETGTVLPPAVFNLRNAPFRRKPTGPFKRPAISLLPRQSSLGRRPRISCRCDQKQPAPELVSQSSSEADCPASQGRF
jgi:hypothetical protein